MKAYLIELYFCRKVWFNFFNYYNISAADSLKLYSCLNGLNHRSTWLFDRLGSSSINLYLNHV